MSPNQFDDKIYEVVPDCDKSVQRYMPLINITTSRLIKIDSLFKSNLLSEHC